MVSLPRMAKLDVEFLSGQDLRSARETPSRGNAGQNVIHDLRDAAIQTIAEVDNVRVTARDASPGRLEVHVDDLDIEAQRAVEQRLRLLVPRGKIVRLLVEHPYLGEGI
jgi:hypothetical protein